MIETLPAVLESMLKAKSLAGDWARWRRRSHANAAVLIDELRNNLRFCNLVLEDDVDIGKALSILSTREFDRLRGEDPSFKSLSPRKIRRYKSLEGTDLAAWQGRFAGDLVENIYHKIKDLQVYYSMLGDDTNRRWRIRVANIRKRILLLLRNSKS